MFPLRETFTASDAKNNNPKHLFNTHRCCIFREGALFMGESQPHGVHYDELFSLRVYSRLSSTAVMIGAINGTNHDCSG